MIFLVTGEINEGKTSYMRSLHKEIGAGDGFICPKVFENGEFIRYDIQRLSSGETMPFTLPLKSVPDDWDEAGRYGKYSFSGRAIHFAEQIIDEMLEQKIEPIIIDEIGPLEIENYAGFYKLMDRVIKANRDAFVAIRSSLVGEFEGAFGIEPLITPITRIGIKNYVKFSKGYL
jgi:nucleoside-triphosphatase THEP1